MMVACCDGAMVAFCYNVAMAACCNSGFLVAMVASVLRWWLVAMVCLLLRWWFVAMVVVLHGTSTALPERRYEIRRSKQVRYMVSTLRPSETWALT